MEIVAEPLGVEAAAGETQQPDYAVLALRVFLVWVLAHIVAGGYRVLVVEQEPWTFLDWLITYDAGFVRRGLSGEVVDVLSMATGASAAHVVLGMHLVGYTVWLGACYVLVRRLSPVPWQLWPMLFSPWLFAYAAHGPYGGFRKDTMVLAVVALVAATAGRYRYSVPAGVWAFVPLVLMHEMSVVFLPYVLVWAWEPRAGRRMLPATIAGLVAVGVAVAASLVWSGGAGHVETICGHVVAVTRPDTAAVCQENSPVSVLALDAAGGAGAVRAQLADYWWSIGPVVVLVLVGLVPALRLLRHRLRRRLAWAFAASTAAMVPVAAVAVDWGRFIHLQATMVAMVLLSMLGHQGDRGGGRWLTRRGTVAVVLLVVFYAATWSIRHHAQLLRVL